MIIGNRRTVGIFYRDTWWKDKILIKLCELGNIYRVVNSKDKCYIECRNGDVVYFIKYDDIQNIRGKGFSHMYIQYGCEKEDIIENMLPYCKWSERYVRIVFDWNDIFFDRGMSWKEYLRKDEGVKSWIDEI